MPKRAVFDPDCRDCPRLVSNLATVRRAYPAYHAGPVPAFGDPRAVLLVVGLAPGLRGANATGRPFTGDQAGSLLYRTLHRFGFSSAAESLGPGDGLRLMGCRITNAVKCLPPGNLPQSDEIAACNGYLRAEIEQVPGGGVLLALGTLAHQALLKALSLPRAAYPFAHGALHRLPDGRLLLDSYHCSRYNLQTRRLTEAMFAAVFELARGLTAQGAACNGR